MHLARTYEGGGGCAVAACAVDRCWGQRQVLGDSGVVVVIMAVKVSGVTGGAGAAIATVDCGIAIAVDADDPGAVGTGVAGKAVVVVDRYD